MEQITSYSAITIGTYLQTTLPYFVNNAPFSIQERNFLNNAPSSIQEYDNGNDLADAVTDLSSLIETISGVFGKKPYVCDVDVYAIDAIVDGTVQTGTAFVPIKRYNTQPLNLHVDLVTTFPRMMYELRPLSVQSEDTFYHNLINAQEFNAWMYEGSNYTEAFQRYVQQAVNAYVAGTPPEAGLFLYGPLAGASTSWLTVFMRAVASSMHCAPLVQIDNPNDSPVGEFQANMKGTILNRGFEHTFPRFLELVRTHIHRTLKVSFNEHEIWSTGVSLGAFQTAHMSQIMSLYNLTTTKAAISVGGTFAGFDGVLKTALAGLKSKLTNLKYESVITGTIKEIYINGQALLTTSPGLGSIIAAWIAITKRSERNPTAFAALQALLSREALELAAQYGDAPSSVFLPLVVKMRLARLETDVQQVIPSITTAIYNSNLPEPHRTQLINTVPQALSIGCMFSSLDNWTANIDALLGPGLTGEIFSGVSTIASWRSSKDVIVSPPVFRASNIATTVNKDKVSDKTGHGNGALGLLWAIAQL